MIQGSINLELGFLGKPKKTTACNFQTMAMNSSVMPHDLMRGQIESYAYMQV